MLHPPHAVPKPGQVEGGGGIYFFKGARQEKKAKKGAPWYFALWVP